MSSKLVIGLTAHSEKFRSTELVRTLTAEFRDRGVEVLLERETARLAGAPEGVPLQELATSVGMLVVLGGDGTLLRVVRQLEDKLCPIFGINLGSLGFLTCVPSEYYMEAVEAICTGHFTLSQRTLLSVEVEREGKIIAPKIALNEAVISRGSLSRPIRVRVTVDGAKLTEYNADGLIIATPTGSTAYSLSAGGPILAPNSGTLLISPICPHTLANRALVLSDTSVITLHTPPRQPYVLLSLDGEKALKIHEGDRLHLRKADQCLPLAMLKESTFSEVLRQKLKWSGSAL